MQPGDSFRSGSRLNSVEWYEEYLSFCSKDLAVKKLFLLQILLSAFDINVSISRFDINDLLVRYEVNSFKSFFDIFLISLIDLTE